MFTLFFNKQTLVDLEKKINKSGTEVQTFFRAPGKYCKYNHKGILKSNLTRLQ